MTSFFPQQKSISRQLFTKWLPAVLLLGVLLLVLKPYTGKFMYTWMYTIVVPVSFITELYKFRVVQISFDEERKQVIFLSANSFNRYKEKILPFEITSLEVHEDGSVMRWFRRSKRIYFLKKGTSFLNIKSRKDQFSVDILDAITSKARGIPLKIAVETI